MYHSCITFGVYGEYVVSLLRKLKGQVSARLLSVEERNAINRVGASDPLIEILAHNLCNNRIKKKMADIKSLE
jgi:hypothetical protein